jgi:hypothetical protein
MLGFLALGLTTIMIYTLIKNALMGKQLVSDESYLGNIELIIPVTSKSTLFVDSWLSQVATYRFSPNQLRIHVLIDGHHPSLNGWQEIQRLIPSLEIHTFTMRPSHLEAVPWMLEQIAGSIQSSVVIFGDAELTPSGAAYTSIAKCVSEKGRTFFVLPQTSRASLVGEAINVLNPTLAFTSFFGFKRWRKNLSHPLLAISQGWLAMTTETFRGLDFKSSRLSSWKELIIRQLDEKGTSFYLAFGEKLLIRHYPLDVKEQMLQLKVFWEENWKKKTHAGFWFFLIALFLWSFPIVCFVTHPYWSIAGIFLLMLYRFFTKIVFQERWSAAFLHPIGALALLVSLLWWISEMVKTKKTPQLT